MVLISPLTQTQSHAHSACFLSLDVSIACGRTWWMRLEGVVVPRDLLSGVLQ